MDANIQRALNDKLYDKRKVGALEYAKSSNQTGFFFSLPVSLSSSASLLLCQCALVFDAQLLQLNDC